MDLSLRKNNGRAVLALRNSPISFRSAAKTTASERSEKPCGVSASEADPPCVSHHVLFCVVRFGRSAKQWVVLFCFAKPGAVLPCRAKHWGVVKGEAGCSTFSVLCFLFYVRFPCSFSCFYFLFSVTSVSSVAKKLCVALRSPLRASPRIFYLRSKLAGVSLCEAPPCVAWRSPALRGGTEQNGGGVVKKSSSPQTPADISSPPHRMPSPRQSHSRNILTTPSCLCSLLRQTISPCVYCS
jgi:hypothetical protein